MDQKQATSEETHDPIFLCDAMLGGLARWLRVAGYKAEFDVHFSDGELVRKSLDEDKVLLTSDSGIPDRYAVSEGLIVYVFIPRDLDVIEQLGYVLGEMDLPLKDPRCMECGGELAKVELQGVIDEVPEKVRHRCSEYWQCRRCDKVYWHGTHWESISERLDRAVQIANSDICQ
ncbi:MAG: Mut7-C RNAse domain-containing protein [Candidatus Brocadiia bacterium]